MNPMWIGMTGALTSAGWLVAHFLNTGSPTAGAMIGFFASCIIGFVRSL